MFNHFHTHHTSLLMLGLLCFILSLSGCGGSSSDSDKKTSEHHDNDHSTPNSDGTTSVSLGNTQFHTTQYKFTDDGHADATGLSVSPVHSYSIGKKIKRFGIDGDSIHAFVSESAFDTLLISYNLLTQTQTSSAKADHRVSGFSFNGVVLTSDGAEDLNFYTVKNEEITDNFFHIKSFNGSKFISDVFLDHNRVYVNDYGGIYSFSIHESGDIKKVMKASETTNHFTADSDHVYIASSDSWHSSTIYRIKKSDQSHELWFSEPSIAASAIAVDSNHIYVAGYDHKSGSHAAAIIKVYKKSDHSHIADITAPYVEDIKIKDGKIYDFNSNTKTLTVRALNFTP